MKTIIFDVDGTIFDTKQGIIDCLNEVLEEFGYDKISDDLQDRYIGPPIKDSLIKFHEFSESDACNATAMYRDRYVSKHVGNSIPYEGLYSLLNWIKEKNYNLCIATMKTRNQVDALLEAFRIESYFDCVETAKYEGGYSKHEMLEKIKLLYRGSEFMFVGDTNGDYKASQKAKISFVYAQYGYGCVEQIDGIVIHSLEDLKSIL